MNRQTKKPLDAEIRFHFNSPDQIEVNEVTKDGLRRNKKVPRDFDIVSELQKRYVFFAKEADHARNLISHGLSCAFYVYFREA